MSKLEETLKFQLNVVKLTHEREYRFAAISVGLGSGIRQRLSEAGLRDWRFDFAFPEKMVAIECDGGQWVNGAHSRGKHVDSDLDKCCAAMRMGWTVYRCNMRMIKSGQALKTIEILMK